MAGRSLSFDFITVANYFQPYLNVVPRCARWKVFLMCSVSFVSRISDSVCAVPGLHRPIGEPGAQHGETGQGCTGWDTRPAAVIHEEQRHRTQTGPLALSNTTDKCPPMIPDHYLLHNFSSIAAYLSHGMHFSFLHQLAVAHYVVTQ